MTVPASYTPNAYYASGTNTVFPYGFKVFDESHLVVTVDSVVQTIATNYTVSGVGLDSGGDITFLSAPANGAYIEIRRSIPLSRETDYQANGELRADTLNADLDRLWMALQEAITTGSLLSPIELGAAIGGVSVAVFTANGIALTNLLCKGQQGFQVATPAISAGTLTLDLTTGPYFQVAHNANITALTITNILASNGSSFVLELVQDGAGGRTFALPASARAAGGVASVAPTTTANARNIYSFVTADAGATWTVSVLKDVKA